MPVGRRTSTRKAKMAINTRRDEEEEESDQEQSQRPQEPDSDYEDNDEFDPNEPSTSRGRRNRGRPPKRAKRTRNSQRNSSQVSEEIDLEADSEDHMKYRINEVVNYCFRMNEKKFPIKRADIAKNTKRAQTDILSAALLTQASMAMEAKHGLKLVDAGSGSFIIVDSQNRRAHQKFAPQNDKERCIRGILLVILSTIMMSKEGHVAIESLWHMLHRMGMSQESEEPFQETEMSASELIKLFAKQLYIKITKDTIGDREVEKVSWGLRAHEEINRMDVLKFVSRIYKCKPEDFREEYAKAKDQLENLGQEEEVTVVQ